MKSHRVFNLISVTFVSIILILSLVACADSVTPTNFANETTSATTNNAAATSTQLPTFTAPAPTKALATVTPAPTTSTTTSLATTSPVTTDATTAAVDTTESVTTTFATTTVAITSAPEATTTKAVNATPKPTGKISSVFNPVMPELRRQKEVPVVLPTYIPGTGEGTVYAVIERSDKPGYSVVLGYTADCNGGSACRIGTVAGEPAVSGIVDLKGIKVKLENNITGYFVNSTCGANCSDSTISWKQGKGVYTVGIKAGKVDELTKMANSAILAGQV